MAQTLKVRIPHEVFRIINPGYKDGTKIHSDQMAMWRSGGYAYGFEEQLRQLWLVKTHGYKFPPT